MTSKLPEDDDLDVLPTGVCLCDAEGRITRFNRRAAELWGRAPGPEDRFDGAWRMYRPDGRPLAKEETPMARSLRTGRTYSHSEVVIERPDGTLIPIVIHVAPIRDASGRIVGAAKSFEDASPKKKQAEALQARTEELEVLMESVPACVWIAHDPEGRRITGNRAASAMLRMPADSSQSRILRAPSHVRVFDAEGRELEGIDLPMVAAAHGQEVLDFEVQLVFTDGAAHWLLGNAVPLRRGDGAIRGSIGVFVDVTERRRDQVRSRFLADAATLLGQSLDVEATMSEVAELSVGRLADWCHVVLMDDSKARTVAVKHRDPDKVRLARELMDRYPFDMNRDSPLRGVLRGGPPVLLAEIPEEMVRAAARNPGHFQLLKKMGMSSAMIVPMHARGRILGAITFVNDSPGRRFDAADLRAAESLGERAGLALDNALLYRRATHEIEERTQAEREVTRLNEELEKRVEERTASLAEAIRELNAFAYSVAHDLRGPIRAMQGFARILLEEYASKMDARAAVLGSRIVESSVRMDRLIADLLEYSRIGREELTLNRLDLDAAVEAVRRGMEPLTSASGALLTVESPMPPVLAHPTSLDRVLWNLLSNALKFVPPGVAPRIRVRAERRGGAVRVWVEDNGIGIEPEHLPKLFRVFERLVSQEEYPGTGMGLAIVRRAVERMNGTCGVESGPGRGSRFWFEIAAADAMPASEAA